MSQPPESTPPTPPAPTRMSRVARIVIWLSCANLAVLCVISYLLFSVSENWWFGTVLTYAPRTPYLIPTLVLLSASILWQRESIGINLISALIILVPIMGLNLPLDVWMNSPSTDGTTLKILSCNVQAFKPAFEKILDEITEIKPDIVAIQEAYRGDPRLDEYFRDWYTLRHHQLWVGSRYPVTLITDCKVPQFNGRMSGMMVQIETPGGPVVLADIHQMTARFGLKKLNRNTLINLDGTKELAAYVEERHDESAELRMIVDEHRGDRPMIVCGDFNVPSTSSLYQKYWGSLQNSFEVAGFGYGYTSPCKGNRFWPNNLPWARIDHILCTSDFVVRQCQIGTSEGSDHRLIAATLVLKANSR